MRPDQNETNFLKRLDLNLEPGEKRSLADHITKNLIKKGDHVFLAVGTTVYRIAERLMKKVSNLKVSTNCVPIAQLYLILEKEGTLAARVEMEVIGGDVNVVTSVIDHIDCRGKCSSSVMIWTPHGITEDGLKSENHARVTKDLFEMHQTVIFPLTYSKLNREGADRVKSLGWMGNQIKKGKKKYIVVLPNHVPKKATEKEIREWEKLLKILEKHGFDIQPYPSFMKPPKRVK